MGFLQDNLMPFFKKKELVFRESYQESEGVYTFLFEIQNDLTWKAGQYGLFTITHKKFKHSTKPFSVASAPAEKIVRITTRIGQQPSEYKQAMLELTPGMKVVMRGPVGPFYLHGNSPALLIAGGIGITPFRSMLKQLEAEGNGAAKKLHLLYLDSDKNYLFKDELDVIAKHSSVKVSYLASRDDLHREIDQFTSLHNSDCRYYVAGPKSMADSIAADLNNKRIPKQNIIKDAFFGY